MSGAHPSEEILQQYVLDRAACRQEEIDHIGNCPTCQALVSIYGMVTTELERQSTPTFDFDVAAAVMKRVQAARVMERPNTPVPERKSGIAVMWTLIALVIVVPSWLFRKSAYFVFTDMSPDFYWVLLAATGLVVGLFILRLHKKYQDVINLINK